MTTVMCWADIEDPVTGAKLGSGPLRQIVRSSATARLSKAGEFTLTVAAADPQAEHLAPKRVVRVRAIVDGTPTEIGAGVIEKIRWDGALNLTVSGADLLGELRHRSVHDLSLVSETQHTPVKVFAHTGGLWHDLTQAYDGISAFFASNRESFTLGGLNEFLYIGYSAPFNVLYTYQDAGGGGSTYNSTPAELNYGYSDGAGNWPGLEVVSDTQIVNDIPWPPSLVTVDPIATGSNTVLFQRNANWQTETVNSVSAYWIRVDPTVQLDTVSVVEFVVGVRSNRLDDVEAIMALSPATWADWDDDYDGTTIFRNTTDGTYAAFAGELVLSALVKIAERQGENFRLGTGRTLHWLRGGYSDSGVRAVRDTGSIRQDDNTRICRIVSLDETQDTSELITRIYPFGAGNGKARVSLTNATLAMPTGYEMDAAANYIKRTASETTYGRIEREMAFKDVRATDDLTFDAVEVCNQLAQVALNYLERHSSPQAFYKLNVAGLSEILRVGETIRVIYREVQDGRVVHDIDDDLIILSESHKFAAGEVYTVSLDVGTTNAWPATDGEIIADMIEHGTVYESHPQPVDANMIKGGISASVSGVAGALHGHDHGALSGLDDDDHTGYARGAGRSGGQTLAGGTGSGDDLTLTSTTHATKGDVLMQPGGGNVGIGTSTPSKPLDVLSANVLSIRARSSAALGSTSGGGIFLEAGATPTAANQRLGVISFGSDNGSNEYTPGGVFGFSAEAWSGSALGVYFDFEVTAIGASSRTKALRIAASGNVGIGSTDPKSKLHVVGLPVYANNAAALAGGLTAGAFYRTGGDPDPVCVVH